MPAFCGLFGRLHELKANLFAALARGEKCVLKLVAGPLDAPPVDGACSAVVRACHEHLQICKLETVSRKHEAKLAASPT